jgi:hypothetical protein
LEASVPPLCCDRTLPTLAVSAPVAEIVPRVLSALPPTVRLASAALVSVPSTLIRSPLVVMFRLPAFSLPPLLSKRSTLALKPLLTFSVPPWLSKSGLAHGHARDAQRAAVVVDVRAAAA